MKRQTKLTAEEAEMLIEHFEIEPLDDDGSNVNDFRDIAHTQATGMEELFSKLFKIAEGN